VLFSEVIIGVRRVALFRQLALSLWTIAATLSESKSVMTKRLKGS
jgi:hypothetical protein